MTARSRWVAVATAGAAAAYFLLFRTGETGRDIPAWDTYALFYPNVLHALSALRDGGHGLLWNPFQNCGQPFFGNVEAGLLYPANVLFLLLDPDWALRGVLLFNLLVAGVSAFLLMKELGLTTVAAVGGALAFELGNATAFMTVWTPQTGGPYAWLPAAMLCCERILRGPSLRRGIALGLVLTLALLPGFPQTVLFIYQLVVLRVVWEFATRRVTRPASVVLTIVLGLVLPALVGAVQLFPAIEVARESLRGRGLRLVETSVLGRLEWQDFRKGTIFRSAIQNPLLLVPAIVAASAFTKRATLRVALFYAVAGLLYFVLAFGVSTPLFELYMKLPWGGLFREPVRFMWLASFCLSVLTAFGLDALVSSPDARSRAGRWIAVCLALLAAAGFFRLAPEGLTMLEWVLAGTALASYAVAALWPARARVAGLVVLAAVAINLIAIPGLTFMRLMPTREPLVAQAHLFDDLRARLTPQDRMYVLPRYPHFDLMQKSASVFGLPSIEDYGSQTSDRYARLYFMLRVGRPIHSRFDTDFLFFGDALQPTMSRRLLDLVGTRYVVSAVGADGFVAAITPPLRLVHDSGARAYENAQALPRAFWVPRVEIVPDPGRLLRSLASDGPDLRQVALVEAAVPSGFTGGPGDGRAGQVEFLSDEPEHLAIRVDAPERGFLFLSDQHFPGWRATVDGTPAEIVRANYAFRLVEVPRGRSTVEFRYAPASVRIGALVSGLTIIALAAWLWATRR